MGDLYARVTTRRKTAGSRRGSNNFVNILRPYERAEGRVRADRSRAQSPIIIINVIEETAAVCSIFLTSDDESVLNVFV